MSFRDEIDLSVFEADDITGAFQLDSLNSLQTSLDNLSPEDFGIDSSLIDTQLEQFSTDTTYSTGTVTYTRENISTADVSWW